MSQYDPKPNGDFEFDTRGDPPIHIGALYFYPNNTFSKFYILLSVVYEAAKPYTFYNLTENTVQSYQSIGNPTAIYR